MRQDIFKNIIVIAFCLAPCTQSYCRALIVGKVISQSTGLPIAYVNIGIIDSPYGTISNEDGSFSLLIPSKYATETILFSALGFETKKYSVETLVDKINVIELNEMPIFLNEVIVKSHSQKTVVLGNKQTIFGTQYCDPKSAGAAMALKVCSNTHPAGHADLKPPLFIQNASLWIYQNHLSEFKVRVRILGIDSLTGLPKRDLLHESVVITSMKKTGWLTVDLSEYHVVVNDSNFFIVFEWIIDDTSRQEILKQSREFEKAHPKKVSGEAVNVNGEMVSIKHFDGMEVGVWFGSSPPSEAQLNDAECYFRTSSHSKWQKSYSILAAQVKVSPHLGN